MGEIEYEDFAKDAKPDIAARDLIITNVFEFNRRNYSGGVTPTQASLYSQIPFVLCGLPSSNPLVLTHKMPDPVLLSHWRESLNYSPTLIVVPPITGRICADTIRNAGALLRLNRAWTAERAPKVWGLTRDFVSMMVALGREQLGSKLAHTVALVDLLDSKPGNHALISRVLSSGDFPFVRYPYLVTPSNVDALQESVEALLTRWHKLIVKPCLTWGGKGTLTIDSKSFDDALVAHLLQEQFQEFSGGSFLIEPFFGTSPEANLSPSVDWFSGERRAICGQMLMTEFRCVGTVYGRLALARAEGLRADMTRFVEQVASYLNELGYSDWFDVDFLKTDAEVFVTEANLRHTGGTVAVAIAERLFGRSWESRIVCISVDGLHVIHSRPENIFRVAARHGFRPEDAGNTFILTGYLEQPSSTTVSFWLSSTDSAKAFAGARAIASDLSGEHSSF